MSYSNPSALFLTSTIIEILKTSFEDPGVYTYVRGDPSRSTIAILEKNSLDFKQLQKRPALVTSRGGVSVDRTSLGDTRSYHEDGTTCFTALLTGSYTIMCISTNPQEAEILSEEVLGCLMAFQNIIALDWDFIKFKAYDIGEVQPHEEYTDSFIVPVTFGFTIERVWAVKRDSPTIARLKGKFSVDGQNISNNI